MAFIETATGVGKVQFHRRVSIDAGGTTESLYPPGVLHLTMYTFISSPFIQARQAIANRVTLVLRPRWLSQHHLDMMFLAIIH